MTITRTPGHADGQTEDAGVWAVRFVEESMAAQLALRSAFANVFVGDFGRVAQSNRGEMQIVSVGADNNRVRSKCFDTVDAVGKGQFIQVAIGPTNHEQVGFVLVLRRAPATAGSVEQIVADESILKRIAGRLRQTVIIPGRRLVTAIVEAVQRNS